MKLGYLSVALKGLIVGASMLVPGVSGGTTAIILGIYDRLIHSVSTFFKDVRGNLLFLGVFCAGALIGIVLFSRVLLYAVETWPLPMMFLFLGAIVGSVPMLYRQAKVERFSPVYVLFALAGVAIVLSLGYLPKPEASSAVGGFGTMAMLFVSGIIIAIALVLPGISTSHMLLVLGMYETTLCAIKAANFLYLVPLALGGLVGVALITSLVERALTRYPRVTYFVIIGFVVGSIIDVFPGYPTGLGIPLCVLTFTAGYVAIRLISKFSKE
jgi:putative membrane protein